ncbi:MAG: Hpt domain-containing protein [Bryobacteraceae bacterium]|jgi:chemotaxis protein histidine kinase CheA
MKIDLERFRETFFQEAVDHVAKMEAGLLAMAAGDINLELLNAVFRRANCIKGAAGTFGLVGIAEFTHAMDILLDGMRSGRVHVENSRIDLLLDAVNVLAAMLDAAREGGAFPVNSGAVRERLTAAQGAVREITEPEHSGGAGAAVQIRKIRFRPSPERAGAIRVATSKVDRLIDLAGELVIAQSMAAQASQEFTRSTLRTKRRRSIRVRWKALPIRFRSYRRLYGAPQHFLYFFPLPHGHGSLRPASCAAGAGACS